ncbi:unnamed protein product [Acanthoscelides obtectus]|uniref:Uncharacterized protein n=1 Tax=Acanthoscelides obtectus TaxID=200917 RepID=A0A9P0L212_ACAOB|nr:unnamed protein product [Acanthoscelides obtectus]CAK1646307.1 hypothetical protein AOBTE_LOCUS14574 [Acanthoscelides obtectus]
MHMTMENGSIRLWVKTSFIRFPKQSLIFFNLKMLTHIQDIHFEDRLLHF